MCGSGQLGRSGAFQKHGVGESLDAGEVDPGRSSHLLYGCARANPRLNVFGTQHGWDLDIDL